jgi:hypothetical protein
MCESFFATLECELLDGRQFKTQVEARIAVFEFIEGFYNPRPVTQQIPHQGGCAPFVGDGLKRQGLET